MRRRTRSSLVVIVIVVCFGGAAFAVERTVAVAGLSVSTATLAPATAVTAVANCPSSKKGDILVKWTGSASAFVSGYTVSRSVNGGSPAALATLPATATSYDDTTVAGSTTYMYSVVADYQLWTSAAAATTLSTPKRC